MEDIITQVIELHKELSAMDKIAELYVKFNEIVPSSIIHAQIDRERMFALIVALLYSLLCIGGEKIQTVLLAETH